MHVVIQFFQKYMKQPFNLISIQFWTISIYINWKYNSIIVMYGKTIVHPEMLNKQMYTRHYNLNK